MSELKSLKKRLYEIDIIKTIAILLILIHHLCYYSSHDYFILFQPYIGRFGLGLFVFISGYSLYYNNSEIKDSHDILGFYKKRLLRIFQLYWVALLIHILIFDFFKLIPTKNFNILTVIEYIFGTQIILAPNYVQISYWGLWYIGMIILFYLIYPFIIYYSKTGQKLFLNCLFVVLGLFIIRYLFNIIEVRVFLYLPLFMSGIFIRSLNLFENDNYKKMIAYMPLLFFGSIIMHLKVTKFDSKEYIFNDQNINPIIVILNMGILLFSFTLLTYNHIFSIAELIKPKVYYLCRYVSFSSYTIYLFHVPILYCLKHFLVNSLHASGILLDIIIIFIFIPLFVVGCHYIQTKFNDLRFCHFSHNPLSSNNIE